MISKQQAKEQIEKLVERFDYHIDEYRKGNYNETQTRNDFINPFFEALGWDVLNKQGFAEIYREVIHEDKIKIAGQSKAPDYCFTVYGQKKFFVEAKKPSVKVKDDIVPAYQLRRYGWSAKLPLSVITDFEEFAVYDCTTRPYPADKASTARIRYIEYKDYIKEIDFFWDVFSKEQILKGSFDKYIKSDKGKKPAASVDSEFLKSLDGWRDLLARAIVNNNKEITEDELNFALQKVMDRVIFLRICEDRGVEYEGQLRNTISENTYQNLIELFQIADQKYNSGLFDFKKDTLTLNLKIDNKTLKTIIEDMYYPKSPYEFSVIPVEILGHSYEQYLGKVIRITPGHRIKIEEKPEVRKAGGVYYTPQYIVDYIVKNTVGKLLGAGDWGLAAGEEGKQGSGDWGLAAGEEGKQAADSEDGYEENINKNINNKEGSYDGEEESQDISGFGGLANVHRDDDGNLQIDKDTSKTGNLRISISDSKSSGFDSSEYSGRLGSHASERIHTSFINSKRVTDGAGDTFDNSQQIGIHRQGNFDSDLENDAKHWQDDSSNDKFLENEKTSTQTPEPRTPSINTTSYFPLPTSSSSSTQTPEPRTPGINTTSYFPLPTSSSSSTQTPEPRTPGINTTSYFPLPTSSSSSTQTPEPRTPRMTPEQIAKLKICDPACGSGSFLLGAYQYLLDYHKEYYAKTNIRHKEKYLTPDGNLTTSVKKEILLNNIYGVDIDSNAVEVTKLSLMLKAMEGETEATISQQLTLLHDRVLPTLDDNIKSGNSLIDLDFYENQIDFDPLVEKKIKPFNWQQSFPEVFKDKIVEENLKAYHVTWVTYNSRQISKNNFGSSVILNDKDRNEIAAYIDEKIGKEGYRVTNISILSDHVHCIIICSEDDLSKIVGQLKGSSSYQYHKETEEINHRVNPMVDKPEYYDGTRKKLWGHKFSHTYLNNQEHIYNAANYIENNHLKHNVTKIEYKFKNLTTLSDAFKPKVIKGGFDVVIGNPPYVNIVNLNKIEREYLKQKFTITKNKVDLYAYFIELIIKQLLKNDSLLGYIISKIGRASCRERV